MWPKHLPLKQWFYLTIFFDRVCRLFWTISIINKHTSLPHPLESVLNTNLPYEFTQMTQCQNRSGIKCHQCRQVSEKRDGEKELSHVECFVVRLSVKKRNKTEKREKKGQRYRESERMRMIRLMGRLPHSEKRPTTTQIKSCMSTSHQSYWYSFYIEINMSHNARCICNEAKWFSYSKALGILSFLCVR